MKHLTRFKYVLVLTTLLMAAVPFARIMTASAAVTATTAVTNTNSTNNFTSATLFAPTGTKTTDGWKNFQNIVEMERNELQDGDEFTALTDEGIEMTFMVISAADKTCQAGPKPSNNWSDPVAIDKATTGHVTVPTVAKGYHVTVIGEDAFRGCWEITSVEIPSSVKTIEVGAFQYCEKLASVNIPNSVTAIGAEAFLNCALTSVVIPSSVTELGASYSRNVFKGCPNLQSIVVEAGNEVFDSRDNCNAIIKTSTDELYSGCKNTTIPASVKSIRDYAFYGSNKLTTLTIPKNIEYMGPQSFSMCENLSSIQVESGNPRYDSRNGCNAVIETTSNKLVLGCSSTMIPEDVTTIGKAAFMGNGIVSLAIPNNINTIEEDAFLNCNLLASVKLPEGLTEIGVGVFFGCSSLKSIDIPESVTKIGSCAFQDSGLESIVIPDNVTIIAFQAFVDCYQLKEVTIGAGVTTIGYLAFYDYNIRTIRSYIQEPFAIEDYAFSNEVHEQATLYVPAGTKAKYEVTEGWSVFQNIVEMKRDDGIIDFADANVKVLCVANWDTNHDGELSYDEAAAVTELGEVFKENKEITSFDELQYFTGLTEIGDNAFYDCNNVTSFVLPESVVSLGNNAFYCCWSLTSFSIPNSVTSIGNNTFAGSNYLSSITIPNSVISIGEFAFRSCWTMESVFIPKSVTFIGDGAFSHTKLVSIQVEEGNPIYDSRNSCNAIIKTESDELISGCMNTIIPNSVKSIGRDAFESCIGLTSIEIPNSVTCIKELSFNGSDLTSITIPNSVTDIGGWSFTNCHSLLFLTISNSVCSIGERAFYNCSKLEEVISYIKNPYVIGNGTFTNSATLYVPVATKALYEATEGWNEFQNIVEMGEPTPYAVLSDDNTTLTFYFNDRKEGRGGMDVGPFDSYVDRGWNEYKEVITKVVFDESFSRCTTLTSTAFWFIGFNNMTTIIGISNLRTDNVNSMESMFWGCSSLTSIDLSGFNTGNVTNMKSMFLRCSSLTSIDLSSFNTGNVTNMEEMFCECSSLESLDLSNFNTSKVTDMSMMFQQCDDLNSLNISSFDTSHVRYFLQMFFCCPSLEALDLSHFNTVNARDMRWMFGDCMGLTDLDVSNFNTINVKDMGEMFYCCFSLTSLDLSSFNTQNVETMWSMFKLSGLRTIYVGEGWTTANIKDNRGTEMFEGCTNLVGGKGTSYNENHIDYTYAHIDGGPDNPGYFTSKKKGDVNADGEVGIGDIVAITNVMAGNESDGDIMVRADVNGDSEVGIGDIVVITRIMAGIKTCPDTNHPHMIDLGLPSGTMWACCNVGASAPEQYGNYYAWGETQPKSYYGISTYQFAVEDKNGDWYDFVTDKYYSSSTNIGSDIAGTGYDAATANWGAPWRMPSLAQCQELINNCTSIWTTQNGVNGRKFTGPNGGTIFLPATGYRWEYSYDPAGEFGDYFTSSLDESDTYHAYNLYFANDGLETGSCRRSIGISVRPVR